MAGLEAAEGIQVFGREFGGEGVPGAGHVLGGHVDDALREPGAAVHGGELVEIGGEAGAEEEAAGDQGGGFAEEGGGVGVGVVLEGADHLAFSLFHGVLRKRLVRVAQR